ncbi:MAG: hypothetical protein EON90_10660 [Brevundimonas sp.]|nr:MAG: hypothetical protein EON90_10660 [Brevundimonas sp.]
MTGRLAEAEADLDALDPDDPEALRLRAYLHLQRGDRALGLAVVEQAAELDPGSPAISRTLATALYAQSLSLLAPHQAVLSPNPLNWMLVRRDDVSQGRLEQALERFERLAQGDPLRASRRVDEAWVLACLGNMPDRRDDAAAQALRMLVADPRDTQVIGWVLMRDLQVDLEPARTALTEALGRGDLEPGEMQTLDWLTDKRGEAALLERIEAAMAAGQAEGEVLEELETVRSRLRSAPTGPDIVPAALEAAYQSGDWAEAEAQFEAAVALDPPPFTILTQASALSAGERWSILARHAAVLRRFGTAGASRIAAIALYNSGDPVGALEILRTDADLFPGGRLPFDLRRVEAEALAQVGDPLQAVSLAAALAADSQTTTDGMREARLRLNLGDIEGAIPKVRAAMQGDALEPHDALVWSEALLSEDPELARELWRLAVSRDIDDPTALQAYGLSFNLGIEEEKPDLLAAVGRLADEGKGVWRVSMDDLVSEIDQRREHAEDLDDKWKRSTAPVHLLARAAGASLADVFDLNPKIARPIFLRAGSRLEASVDPLALAERSYFLDVSALLIAHQLDLLPVLESFGPRLNIAAATPHALLEIERATRHHQPGRGVLARRILAEVGRRIGLDPPDDAQTVVQDKANTPGGFDLGEVLTELESVGAATPEQLAQWRRMLQVSEPPLAGLVSGKGLVFTQDTLDRVFDIGAFDAVAAAFPVFLDRPSLARARSMVEELQRTATLTLSVSRLRRRIARKAADHYQLVGGGRNDIDLSADAFSQSAVGRALAEIMTVAGDAPHNRLWVEDRFLSSFAHAGQATIVGIYDMLSELRRSGRIDDDGYFDRLMKLRRGGALFLPLETDEIDHHLIAAPIRDGAVVETPGLAVLRKNVALAQIFADRMRLVATGDPDERPLEVDFLLHLRRIGEAAVVARWNAQTSSDAARAQSDWIWRSLRAETLPRPGATDDSDGAGAETVVALNVSGLLAAVFHLRAAWGEPGWKRREHYLEWLNDTVLKDRLARDPGVEMRAVEWARDFFRLDDPEDKTLSGKDRESLRALTRAVLAQLPAGLRDAMAADAGFMRDLGFGETTGITVENRMFAASAFWRAVADAVNENQGEAGFSDGDGRVIFRRADDEPGRIDLTGDLSISLRDSSFSLLSRDPDIRASGLTSLFEECDIPGEDRSAIEAAVLGEAEPDRRIQQARLVRDRSVRLYLERLAADLQSRDDVGVEDFNPPAARDWLTFVRWRDPAVRMDQATVSLRRDLTPAVTVGRISGLPFTPPDVLWAGVEVERLRSMTPVSRIQRLRAVRLGLIQIEGSDLNQEIISTVETVSRLGPLFVALLHWGAEAFAGQDEWANLPPLQKHVVSWCFADRVTDLLASLGADAEEAIRVFKTRPSRRAGADLLALEHGHTDSSLHPASVNPTALLMAGLEYALGEDAGTLELSSEAIEAVGQGLGVKSDQQSEGPAVRVFPPRPEVGPTWMDRPDPEAILKGQDLDATIGAAIDALDLNPADETAWAFLYAVGTPALQDAAAARLADVFSRLDPAVLVTGEKPIETLRYAAESAGRFTDAGQMFLGRLSTFAPAWLKDAGPASFTLRLEGVIEAAAGAARSYDGSGPRKFADFAVGLIFASPDTAPVLRDVLDALVDRTPARLASPFWKALLAARAA